MDPGGFGGEFDCELEGRFGEGTFDGFVKIVDDLDGGGYVG